MPLTVPASSSNPLAGPTIGFYGVTPVTRPGTYTWGYNAQSRDLPAYTPNTQTTAYTGGLLDLTQALRLSDGNALRVAVENLRVLAENTAKQHNALATDLMNMGIIQGA